MKEGNDEILKDHELVVPKEGVGEEGGFDGPTSNVTVKSSFGCDSRQHHCTIFWSWVVASLRADRGMSRGKVSVFAQHFCPDQFEPYTLNPAINNPPWAFSGETIIKIRDSRNVAVLTADNLQRPLKPIAKTRLTRGGVQ